MQRSLRRGREILQGHFTLDSRGIGVHTHTHTCADPGRLCGPGYTHTSNSLLMMSFEFLNLTVLVQRPPPTWFLGVLTGTDSRNVRRHAGPPCTCTLGGSCCAYDISVPWRTLMPAELRSEGQQQEGSDRRATAPGPVASTAQRPAPPAGSVERSGCSPGDHPRWMGSQKTHEKSPPPRGGMLKDARGGECPADRERCGPSPSTGLYCAGWGPWLWSAPHS
mgnify:CR=1 FL=1